MKLEVSVMKRHVDYMYDQSIRYLSYGVVIEKVSDETKNIVGNATGKIMTPAYAVRNFIHGGLFS